MYAMLIVFTLELHLWSSSDLTWRTVESKEINGFLLSLRIVLLSCDRFNIHYRLFSLHAGEETLGVTRHYVV